MPPLEDLAKRVINSFDVVMGYWSRDLRCLFANAAYETWFGRSQEEMLAISVDEFLGSALEIDLPLILGALKGNPQEFERDVTLPNGEVRRGLISFRPDFNDGGVRGFSVQVVDITRSRQLELRLEECNRRVELLTSHDFLTRLPNRYLLTDRIFGLISQAETREELLGVILLNIDGFSRINDIYGPDESDGVLREIARRMREEIQPTDAVIRMHGDEFLLLVTRTRDVLEANVRLRHLLTAVQQPLQYMRASVTPSLSFGSAFFPLDGKSVADLLATASRSLDAAKARRLRL